MKLKKSLSLLLALVMIVSLVPMAAINAFAAANDPAIRDVSALLEDANNGYALNVYYGNGKQGTSNYWRPFSVNINGTYNGGPDDKAPDNTVRMISAQYFGETQYSATAGALEYNSSSLKAAMDAIPGQYFSDAEIAAIRPRDISSGSANGKYATGINGGATGLLLWPISAQDAATNTSTKKYPAAGTYWLRGGSGDEGTIGYVTATGYKAGGYGDNPTWKGKATTDTAKVLPALDLKAENILLVSIIGIASRPDEANGGKSYGNGVVAELPASSGKDVRLTLLDTTRSAFTAATTAVNGSVLTVSYSEAKTGANEFISVIILDSATGKYSHYGRIAQVTAAAGTVDVDLTDIDMTGKILYVFNEQYNGDELDQKGATDYASKFTPVITSALTATAGQTLADVTLPTGWEWVDATTTPVGNAGTNFFKANCTMTLGNALETAKYNVPTNVNVPVAVGKLNAEKPTVAGVDETAEGANDGKITGVTDKMQYRKEGADTWTAVTGTEITGLAPGKYEVRLAETETHNASEAALVEIKGVAHEHAFGTEWKSDANGHWNECACTEKGNAAAHDPKIVNAKPATASENGYSGDKVCSVCGYEIAKGAVVPYTENPKTGDNSFALCVALLLVSCFGIAGAAYFGKKVVTR